jgi:hypothetical protein
LEQNKPPAVEDWPESRAPRDEGVFTEEGVLPDEAALSNDTVLLDEGVLLDEVVLVDDEGFPNFKFVPNDAVFPEDGVDLVPDWDGVLFMLNNNVSFFLLEVSVRSIVLCVTW